LVFIVIILMVVLLILFFSVAIVIIELWRNQVLLWSPICQAINKALHVAFLVASTDLMWLLERIFLQLQILLL